MHEFFQKHPSQYGPLGAMEQWMQLIKVYRPLA
jgi:hypothetical protein